MDYKYRRKILKITYIDRITNIEVRNRILQSIGPHKDLLTKVKEMKLRWYGHVCRNNNSISKDIFQGTENGTRRRERPRMKWYDNIRDGTQYSVHYIPVHLYTCTLYRLQSLRFQAGVKVE